jgi:predicted  nucleic acid-binding Zn-ribbon protein
VSLLMMADDEMEKQISAAPERVKHLQVTLTANERNLLQVKALQTTYDTYIRLAEHEIPKLEAEMKNAEAKLAEANKGFDQVPLPLFPPQFHSYCSAY